MREAAGADIILLNSKKEVLLYLRDDIPTIPSPNCWAFLGGYIEEHESPIEAVCRELREEIDLDLKEVKFFKYYSWAECDEYIFWHQIDLDLKHIHLTEGQGIAYFSQLELLNIPLASHYRTILAEFFDYWEHALTPAVSQLSVSPLSIS